MSVHPCLFEESFLATVKICQTLFSPNRFLQTRLLLSTSGVGNLYEMWTKQLRGIFFGEKFQSCKVAECTPKRLVTESLEIEIASLPDILSRAHAKKKKIRNCYVLLQIVGCSVLKGPSGDFPRICSPFTRQSFYFRGSTVKIFDLPPTNADFEVKVDCDQLFILYRRFLYK